MANKTKKKILFVDDEPSVLSGLKRMLRGMRAEWDMSFVESGEKALELLGKDRFDVIVSDMRMPGMDGAELLTLVMKQYPEVVRIVLSGHSDREMILRSVRPAQQYLSKPCDAETLKSTVTRACALRDLLVEDSLKRVVSQMDSLPSLPKLYQEIMAEIQSEDPSIQKVGEIIAKDVGMTAKILQLVNSAFFGMPRHIKSPQQAVTLLGLETVKALVLSVQIFSQFDGTKIPKKFLEGLWHHSMATGSYVRQIIKTEEVEKTLADDTYMAAVLHDVGKLILAASFPDRYRELIKKSRENRLPIRHFELEDFGTTHAEVGAYLMGLWGLPDAIVEALAFHHRLAQCPVQRFAPLIAVHVASALEHQANNEEQIDYSEELDTEHLNRLELADRLDPWKEACNEIFQ
ncbi:MAG: HDOD domain-containing protein [Deltaproteobacteria bacterium]|nr:HDOD domain-containing protein [Deltaproteobacteria bacterium]MBW1929629.1 HDOD domain-containing protein [Deltaproteobacteria bacterium]